MKFMHAQGALPIPGVEHVMQPNGLMVRAVKDTIVVCPPLVISRAESTSSSTC